MRIIFFLYSIFLSILLLSQDPTRWVGAAAGGSYLLKMLLPLAHLISFAILSFFALAALFPLPRWSVLLILGLYGTATEGFQFFVPRRRPDWTDVFQDFGGVLLGFVLFVAIVFVVKLIRGKCREAVSDSACNGLINLK